jgi:sulfite exporter TauE/SafE
MTITFLCGAGHVLSSIILGIIGITAGISLNKIRALESPRGSIAGYLLTAFGFIYLIWAVWRLLANKTHTHSHIHEKDGHEHLHSHNEEHQHVHSKEKSVTLWALFLIFIFGPCEPLIPLLMFPAYEKSLSGVILVTAAFAVTTITTMMTIVFISSLNIKIPGVKKIAKYTHIIAGCVLLLSGIAISFLGL